MSSAMCWKKVEVVRLQLERLQDLLGDVNFLGSIAAGTWSERDADRIPDPLGQKNRQRRGAGDDSF